MQGCFCGFLYQILKIVWRTKLFQIIIDFSIKAIYKNKVFMFG